jgi:hypothetical protein
MRYLPDVELALEHEALQRVVKNYPTYPYDEWRHLQSKEIANLQASRHEVRLVEVTAEEFTADCAFTGATCDLGTFNHFIVRKGRSQQN